MSDMTLKIVLPYKVFADYRNVCRITVQTANGSMGILPHRLDCVTALPPGILKYQVDGSDAQYVAIDEGALVKTGANVLVSVRNAVGGANLGRLREAVEKEFKNLEEKEKNVRSALAKMESGFIRAFKKLHEK